jgi:hypothetical protein
MYDIVFISYKEVNADKHFNELYKRFPVVQRVDGVQGIHKAHKTAASKCLTKMFWVVDGDAKVLDDFNFDFMPEKRNENVVHVWRSKNPINNLEYGYGGVKLLPRRLTLEMKEDTTDMTTSISNRFRAMEQVSNISVFNTNAFNTFKSAFRECVKLSSKVIDRGDDKETDSRLDVWCTVGKDKLFGSYAIKGALAGKEYGSESKDLPSKLKLINNFTWLKEYYKYKMKDSVCGLSK